MKKLFALLFVCAGLTAMAAQPMHINRTAKKTVKDASSLVMKQNSFQKVDKMNMLPAENQMTMGQFFRNRSISDNALNRRAPHRIDSTAMVGNYVYSNFQLNMVDGTVVTNPYYVNGHDSEITLEQTFVDYNVGYLKMYPFPALFDLDDGKGAVYYLDMIFYADYGNEYVLLDGGITGNNYTWTTREEISAPRQQVGYRYTFLDWGIADLAYMMGQSDTIADYVAGEIVDGAIIIEDGYGIVYQKSYYDVYFNAQTGALIDMQFVSEDPIYKGNEVYLDTYILPANGTHEYTQVTRTSNVLGNSYVFSREEPETNYVYMYQVEDSVFVWNMWNMGMYDEKIVLFPEEDGYNAAMLFQEVWRTDMTSIREYYNDDSSDEFYNFYELYDLDVDTIIGQAPYGWATPMFVNEDNKSIEWNCSGVFDVYTVDGELEASVGMRYILNKLNFDNEIVMPVPVEPEYELGDVDHSGGVDIEDVTILINAVLGNQPDIYYPENANCDGEGGIDIGDVTALITRVLNGVW